MKWQRRLARLEQIWPAPPPPSKEDLQRQKRWISVVQRLGRLLGQADKLMTGLERKRVGLALDHIVNGFSGPFANWFTNLRDGSCRLPELTPSAMKDLLLAWISPEADRGMVCRQCGLEYPKHKYPPLSQWKLLPGKRPMEGPPPWYDLPYLFAACPGCGAARDEIDWPHLMGARSYSWQQCDGYVGNRE
jgi:hypothetical protein